MTIKSWLTRFAAALVLTTVAGAATAQDTGTLRRDIERRFDVLPLRDGIALRPKAQIDGVKSIELTDGAIAIDGGTVTGAELRDRLGADAENIVRLSYMDKDAQRALFDLSGSKPREPAAPPPSNEAARPASPSRRQSRGDQVRFGGSISIGPDEIVNGDVVVIGGAAHIDGEVTGDVVAVGGLAELGPTANVHGDLTVVGGTIHRDDHARVGGSVSEVGAFDRAGLRRGRWLPPRLFAARWGIGSLFALMSTIVRFAVLCLLVSIAILLGREQIERIGDRASAEPLKAGLIGFFAQLLILPVLIITSFVLVITIVGIPLLVLIPFALLALAIVWLIGFTAVVYRVGGLMRDRLGWTETNAYLTAILGIAVVLSPILVARLVALAGGVAFPLVLVLTPIGLAFEYLVWTVGLGAVALLRFERRPAV